MTGFVVIVDFRLKPGRLASFRALVERNARESCRSEPGCRRFDVLVPTAGEDRIVLYEIYDDRQAFARHLEMPHYHRFNSDSAPHVLEKSVGEFALACEGSAALTP
jgi:quinol monooxygenase YgiN